MQCGFPWWPVTAHQQKLQFLTLKIQPEVIDTYLNSVAQSQMTYMCCCWSCKNIYGNHQQDVTSLSFVEYKKHSLEPSSMVVSF